MELKELFKMQMDLNNLIFDKHNLKDNQGNQLEVEMFYEDVNDFKLLGVNDLPNRWLTKLSLAMYEELIELDNELLWKWWSNDKIDIQNIRVELIDLLHFLISAIMTAGMTADDVERIYKQKHALNIKRQDDNYSKLNKNEDDNKNIM